MVGDKNNFSNNFDYSVDDSHKHKNCCHMCKAKGFI